MLLHNWRSALIIMHTNIFLNLISILYIFLIIMLYKFENTFNEKENKVKIR